nr:hypothetical protein [Tanacetum cinerariifolium]
AASAIKFLELNALKSQHEDLIAFCLGEALPNSRLLRFVSIVAFCLKTHCILSQDSLRFVSRLAAFCLKTHCIFVSKLAAFCLKNHCVLSQDSLHFVSGIVAFCPLRFVYHSSLRLAIPLQINCSRPNGKIIVDSIENGTYVRRMIATPGEPDLSVPVPESFHELPDEELTETDIKRIDADDQAIQTILLGLPEDIYAAVDSFEIAKEIWERVRQMMKGSDIGEQEKKAKLFNEWEKFTSTDGESIESYYHRFMQLLNNLKRKNIFQKTLHQILSFSTTFSLNGRDTPP